MPISIFAENPTANTPAVEQQELQFNGPAPANIPQKIFWVEFNDEPQYSAFSVAEPRTATWALSFLTALQNIPKSDIGMFLHHAWLFCTGEAEDGDNMDFDWLKRVWPDCARADYAANWDFSQGHELEFLLKEAQELQGSNYKFLGFVKMDCTV